MPFEVKARVLLELGSELISSDAIALYELIKNALDAGSRRTEVKVAVTLKYSSYHRFVRVIGTGTEFSKEQFMREIEDAFEPTALANGKKLFLETLRAARTTPQLRKALDEAYRAGNRIDIIDNGHGMALSELTDVYLTVGTTARLQEKRALFDRLEESDKDPAKVPLGEKGIGRLAAMRLGDQLEVRTARKDDRRWNLLAVNWAALREDINQDLSDFEAEATQGAAKEPSTESGTRVRIQILQSDWTIDKLNELSKTEFAKLYDPFAQGVRRDDIRLSFNGNEVDSTVFERELLEHADAHCKGEFRSVAGVPVLSGQVNFRLYDRQKTFRIEGIHLANIVTEEPGRPRKKRAEEEEQKRITYSSEAVVDALDTVGPFTWEFHWFNRGRLRKDEFELWNTTLQEFVAQWSGGLLVYRDGYRVYPYGAPEDDWLDLDRNALAASGYKLNRTQIVGRLKISSRWNPQLQDQTNREGFRECPEKLALVRMLRHVFLTETRTFLEKVSDENRPVDKDDLVNIERRLETSGKEAERRIRDIGRRIPQEKDTVNKLLDYLREVTLAWEKAKEVAETFESDLEKYLHLAGIGLMVEFIAHELTRATQNALETLEGGKASSSSSAMPATLETLRAQLKTIEKRLRVLDPLSTPGRQRRTMHNVSSIVEEVLESHSAQFKRHDIKYKIENYVDSDEYRVEKGQIVQILENLVSNSVYWLRERQAREDDFAPSILVRIEKGKLVFRDNGPGIPEERGEDVFTPFFTTKPPGRGRGLGLYIARKLAEYNDATLELEAPNKEGTHKGFVLTFAQRKK